MFDSISTYKYIPITYHDVHERLNLYKTEYTSKYSGEVQILYTGMIENLIINIRSTRIRITGSLAKFYFGNNLQMLDRKTTKLAIKKLENILQINWSNAYISKLHFGFNILLDQKVDKYLPQLGSIRRMKYDDEFLDNGTLYLKQKIKSISLYDKLSEMEMYSDIPSAYRNQNVLRIELKLNSSIRKQLKFNKPLKLKSLYNIEVYHRLQNYLYEHLNKLQKERKTIMDLSSVKTPKDLKRFVMLKGIESIGGLKMIQSIINEVRTKNELSNTQYKNLNRGINSLEELYENDDFTRKTELMEEVDRKIKSILTNEEHKVLYENNEYPLLYAQQIECFINDYLEYFDNQVIVDYTWNAGRIKYNEKHELPDKPKESLDLSLFKFMVKTDSKSGYFIYIDYNKNYIPIFSALTEEFRLLGILENFDVREKWIGKLGPKYIIKIKSLKSEDFDKLDKRHSEILSEHENLTLRK